jgi:hypothetical protein
VAEGEAHIGRQEALVAELDLEGRDTKEAFNQLAIWLTTASPTNGPTGAPWLALCQRAAGAR